MARRTSLRLTPPKEPDPLEAQHQERLISLRIVSSGSEPVGRRWIRTTGFWRIRKTG